MGIGRRIKYHRQLQDISQRKLARAIGVSSSALNQTENNDGGMQAKNLYKAARFLGVPYEVFLRDGPIEDSVAISGESLAIPVVAEGSAGEGDGFVEYAYWAAPKLAGKTIRAILVRGDCLEPEIRSGDVLFAQADVEPREGDVVICLIEDKMQIKRYRQDGHGVWLENRYGRIDLSGVEIQGVVIEKNIKMRR